MPQQWIWGASGGGVSDHGALTGLADDDHSQYHNDARGDLRYSQLGHNHDLVYSPLSHTHTESDISDLGSYLTQTDTDLLYSVLGHAHVESDISDLGSYLTEAAADLLYADIAHTHGAADHGALSGLSDDDHTQYHTDARGDARYSLLGHNHDASYYTETEVNTLLTGYSPATHNHDASYSSVSHTHVLDGLSDVDTTGAVDGKVLTYDTGAWVAATPASGVTDHGLLSGLADDDHTQYHTDARGDARYSLLAHNHDAAYYTESEVDTLLTGYSPTSHNHSGVYSVVGHTHTESDISDLGAYLTEAAADLLYADISHTHSAPDHGALGGLTDDDHTQYALLAGRSGGQALYGGTASGDDLYIYSTSSATKGDIVLANGGGKVGIGQAPDAGVLQVYAGNSGGTPFNANYVPISVENSTSAYIQFLTPNTAAAGLVFSDPEDWDNGAISYNHSTQTMLFTADAVDTMYLTDGNVGIGTTSPGAPLHVSKSVGTSGTVDLAKYGVWADDGGRLLFDNNYGSMAAIKFTRKDSGSGANDGCLFFQTAVDAVLYDRVTIDNTGNVGIGTTSPQAPLHVNGGILIDGDSGGYAGAVGLTDVTTGVSSGTGTIKMAGTTARNSTGWLKIYVGTTAVYLPYFTTITG